MPVILYNQNQSILNSTTANTTSTSGTDVFYYTTGLPYYTSTAPTLITSGFTTTHINTASTCNVYIPIQNGFHSTNTTANIVYYSCNSDHLPVAKPKYKPLIEKSVKSSIKRALKLFSNFGMDNDIRVFLSGETMEISHHDSMFKFVISKKRNNLINSSRLPSYSTPYNLSLYTKSSIHIADLCVVIEKTPILDQLLALNMFVETGNEEDILLKANYFNLTKDLELRKLLARENPKLENKLRVNFENMEDIAYR